MVWFWFTTTLYHQNNHCEGPNTGCQNVAIKAFPVMIATREESTPCPITHHTLSWPPFAPVKASKPIYSAVFALFFAVARPESYPYSYRVLWMVGIYRSWTIIRSTLFQVGLVDLTSSLVGVWTKFWHHASAMRSGARAPTDSFPLFRDAYYSICCTS